MKPIREYKTLGITFAPALGGNHVANMISTSPYIQNRFREAVDYEQYLIDLYVKSNGNNFHAEEFLNVGVDDHNKAYSLVSSNELTTVLPGHIEDCYWVFDKIKSLGPMGFITFEVFNVDLYNFYKNIPKRSYVKTYNPFLYRFLYTKEVVSRLLDIPLSDGYVMDAEKIIESDITELLNQLNDELSLDMNLALCKELHAIRHTKAYR